MNVTAWKYAMQYAMVFAVFLMALNGDVHGCPRKLSRVVRNVVEKKLYPLFSAVNVPVPISCPLFEDRDMYKVQEENKIMETVNKWICDFCGKAFLHEYFLDLHFDNRHPDYVGKRNDTVCLADYCDYFRCDIIIGELKADFWDVALCLEDDMIELSDNCEEFLFGCIPEDISRNVSQFLKDKLYEEVCSFLTCKKYWEKPEEEVSSNTIVMYTVFSIFICIILIIYYCVAYHYFYTDTFSDIYEERYENRSFGIAAERASHIEMRQRRAQRIN